jgi:tripartite motif-containing protein 71
LVSFSGKHVVRCYNQEGVAQFTIGKPDYTSGSGDGEFKTPMGLVLDSIGNINVCDCNNKRIQRFNSGGTYLFKFNTPSGKPLSITCDNNNNLYIADNFGSYKIQVYGYNGTHLAEIGIDLPESEFGYSDVHFGRIRG